MTRLAELEIPENYGQAVSSGFDAFDEMFGNQDAIYGAVKGKVVMVSAPPGTGKSRAFVTAICNIGRKNPDMNIGYITNEQAIVDLAAMAKRMHLEIPSNVYVVREDRWENIKRMIAESKLDYVVIDALPLVEFPQIIDEDTKVLRNMKAKEKFGAIAEFTQQQNFANILINHTTKGGAFAGVNTLLHLVDVAITLKVNLTDYDGIKVVEWYGGKNREGTPVNRAFPFNGTWDFTCPMEIKSSKGSESGGLNDSLIKQRKEMQHMQLMEIFANNGNVIFREQIESGEVSIQGLAMSGFLSLLRDMAAEGKLKVSYEATGHRPKVCAWELQEVVTVDADFENSDLSNEVLALENSTITVDV